MLPLRLPCALSQRQVPCSRPLRQILGHRLHAVVHRTPAHSRPSVLIVFLGLQLSIPDDLARLERLLHQGLRARPHRWLAPSSPDPSHGCEDHAGVRSPSYYGFHLGRVCAEVRVVGGRRGVRWQVRLHAAAPHLIFWPPARRGQQMTWRRRRSDDPTAPALYLRFPHDVDHARVDHLDCAPVQRCSRRCCPHRPAQAKELAHELWMP